MIILGISAYHGDCSASIIKDGKLIAATEEERFTRIKHWAGFPENAMRYCLDKAMVNLMNVDYIAVARNPAANLDKKLLYLIKHPASWKKIIERLKNRQAIQTLEYTFSSLFNIPVEAIKIKMKHIEHHKAHLASTFLVSPFKESAVVSLDGFGDFVSAMYGTGEQNKINIFKRIFYPHSLGIFYTMITQFLGFKKYGDEYKVMGLAAYGRPEYRRELEDIITYTDNGEYRLNMKYFVHNRKKVDFNWESGEPVLSDLYSKAFLEKFGPPRNPGEPVKTEHKNLAAAMQKHTENIIFEILRYCHQKTGQERLSLSGGVGMNSVANGKILTHTPFKDVYIPPAAGDAGTSMGAAFYLWNQILENDRFFTLDHAYWGPEFTTDEIQHSLKEYEEELKKNQASVETILSENHLLDRVIDLISKGKVVGWFQGRMEFGARALGNRSIIVDPRRADMKDILNDRIKKREKFRPFAPSILNEEISEWFEQNNSVPFMEKVYRIKEVKRKLIPAVTHVDGTGRLQTVTKSQNLLYHKLIKKFSTKTGVPILLNTSFNENEPIVCTPKEALEVFIRTKMDALVLNTIMIKRNWHD